ncbi:unnamed protein product [Lupinus luteus]|uniref:Uncharacterized protein n=1 Tax=Lupinus luteus TaxID=3873 RepID=A0AAV1WYT2_LUPLU
MSSFLPLILLFVLCVSLHACIARPLAITKPDTQKYHFHKEKMRHARSMLGPTRLHVEKAFITNPNDTTEDFSQIDYAQPHRRLPIHN